MDQGCFLHPSHAKWHPVTVILCSQSVTWQLAPPSNMSLDKFSHICPSNDNSQTTILVTFLFKVYNPDNQSYHSNLNILLQSGLNIGHILTHPFAYLPRGDLRERKKRSEAESVDMHFCCCCCRRRRDLPWWQWQLMQEEAVSPELSRELVVEWDEGNEDTSLRRGRIVQTHRRSKIVFNTTKWSMFMYSLTKIVSKLKMWPSGRQFE